ncbi:MrcB family domain-containing protein [Brenneria goodwinii]|uniref:MrcB family domain-containing protein n=1 Tax=Brenneria goodwinii TaxID=1109412 RepID=UPI0036E3037B
MQFLNDVFEDYKELVKFNNGKINKKYFFQNYKSTKSIFNSIPEEFKKILSNKKDEFIIKPSIGQTNVTDIPWICILNKRITHTPQVGYYIALLFSYDMSGCYLSLNQAATEARKICGTPRKAIAYLAEVAESTKSYLTYSDSAIYGPIDLKARSFPGTGYEKAAIQSFYYRKDALPSVDKFQADLKTLLSSYDNLERLFSTSLASTSEELFDQYVLGLAALENGSDEEKSSEQKKAKDKKSGNLNVYPRDPKVSSNAIKKAKFLCEYDASHISFISKISNQNYVEAHHLIPMSYQSVYEYSIDIEENIISLCPICHRTLHHGLLEDKKIILLEILKNREKDLKNKGFNISMKDLMRFYS